MRIALGIIARPVESLLVLCLRPVIAHFDGLVMLTKWTPEWMQNVKCLVHGERQFHLLDYKWRHDYAEARNILIGHTERLGYDWLLMLDADESMLPDDLIVMRKYMETEESLIFPRYEFVDDFNHYCPWFYPDWQARAFRLNHGFQYRGTVHEQLFMDGYPVSQSEAHSTKLPMCPIFHYGKSKTPEETWLKYANYSRIAAGQESFSTLPENAAIPKSWALDKKKVPFLGNKPL